MSDSKVFQAEKERQQLSLMLDLAPGLIIIHDSEGHIFYANQNAIDLHGYSREEFMRTNLRDLIMESSPPMVERIPQILKEGGASFEVIHIRKDGSTFPLMVNVRPADWGDRQVLLSVSTEISEIRRAEKELRFRNILLSTQFEVSPEGILVVDEKGKILLFNRRLIEMWGVPLEVIESKSDELALQSILGKLADPEEFIQRVQFLYENRREISHEEVVLVDGRVFDRYSAPMLGDDGSYYGRIWNFRDITIRKHIEDDLRESEERFRSAFEQGLIGMSLQDTLGRFLKVNAALCTMMDYSEQELTTKTFRDLTHPEDQSASEEWFGKLLSGEAESLEMEKRYLRKDGGIIWGIVKGALMRNKDGSPRYFLVHVQEITKRKLAEQALGRSEEKFRLLFESSRDPILLLDETNCIFDCNEAAVQILGASLKSELTGKFSPDFTPEFQPDGRLSSEKGMEMYQKVIKSGSAFSELTHVRQDGSEFTVDASMTLIPIEKQKIFLIHWRDITEKKQADNEREKLIGELQSALSEVKTLSGLLPICASCKKIRDDKGYWNQIEGYIQEHSDAEFSHSVCPDCIKKLYPEFADDLDEEKS